VGHEEVRGRLWAEVAVVCAVPGSIAFVVPDWIEKVLGIDPDGGSGAVEG